jgi:hemolysin activation/secretion protein
MDGLLAKASYSYGLSDTRSESEGGGYHGLSLSLEHPTPYGIFALNYSYSDSKQGGIYVPLDMNQTVHISDIQYIMPTVWGEYNAGIKHVDQSMEMKAIDLEASQDYQAAFAGLNYKKHFITEKPEFWSQINVSNILTYGFNQNTDGILYGLPADDNWIKYELKVNYDQRIHDFTLSSGFGLQFSDSDNLPNHEEFFIGGPKRGNSYYPGVASTSEGWFAHTRLYTKPIAYSFKDGLSGLTVTPFIGLNYSTGDDLAGVKQEAKSAEMGINLNLSNKLVGELGYSKSIDNRFNVDYDDRLMFNLSYLF